MRRRYGWIAAGVAAATALAITAGAFAHTDSAAAPGKVVATGACTSPKIAIEAPLTGPAGFLGQEQREWAQMALANANKKYHLKVRLQLSDTQLDQALARTVGLRDEGDTNVLAVIGPSTSGAVLTNGKLFSRAHLAAISPSATKIELTNGQFSSFFRVVPNDSVQGAGDANYMIKVLKVKHVFVVDGQEPYSIGLAGVVEKRLRAARVRITHDSTDPNKETDFSSIVTKVASDVNIVFLPWQVASAAQTFSQQLLQQGKRAIVFGTDGDFDPTHFKPQKGYISSFAPDIHGLKSARGIIAQFKRTFPSKTFGTFGPPSYVATWIAATAISKACANGKATRSEVTKFVRGSKTRTLWNTTIRFTKHGDATPGKSYIFRITNGQYTFLTSFG